MKKQTEMELDIARGKWKRVNYEYPGEDNPQNGRKRMLQKLQRHNNCNIQLGECGIREKKGKEIKATLR